MTEAVLGTFADCKIIKTRSVLQIIVEIPIEQADEALKALGGIPQPGMERWIGIALAKTERQQLGAAAAANTSGTTKPHRPFQSLKLSQQAGIRSNEGQFMDFLVERSITIFPERWTPADEIKSICTVGSRSELDTNEIAGAKWKKLEADYQAYLTDLRYAGSPGL